MKTAGIGLVFLLAAGSAAAQAPSQDRAGREQAIHSGQVKAGAAYSDMQQARREAKIAEQNFLNAQEAQRAAQDAQRAAQKHAEETKQQLDSARKALDAARAREVQARKAYDNALIEVERAVQGVGAR